MPEVQLRRVDAKVRRRPRAQRRRAGSAAVLIGLVVVLSAACGSAPSASSASPVDACPLLSTTEAAALLGAPAAKAHPSSATMQSGCFYSVGAGGRVLFTTVSWSKQQLDDFRKVHGLATGSSSTTSAPASSTSTVPGTRVEVDGVTAFWVSPLPTTGPGSLPDLSQLTATKNGYVVGLEGTALDVTQATGALGAMLGRL